MGGEQGSGDLKLSYCSPLMLASLASFTGGFLGLAFRTDWNNGMGGRKDWGRNSVIFTGNKDRKEEEATVEVLLQSCRGTGGLVLGRNREK